MFGLAPAGLGGGDGSRGESFGFLFPRGICFPPRGKVVAKATHTVEAETRNFLFWAERRDLWTCGGRGRGLVQDICYELVSDQRADKDQYQLKVIALKHVQNIKNLQK